MYISVTGLRIKRTWLYPWHVLVFWRHAAPAYNQAQNADGNIKALAFSKNGYHHTITVWKDQDAMRSFIYDGAHMKAIGIFGKIATGNFKFLFLFSVLFPPFLHLFRLSFILLARQNSKIYFKNVLLYISDRPL